MDEDLNLPDGLEVRKLGEVAEIIGGEGLLPLKNLNIKTGICLGLLLRIYYPLGHRLVM